MEFSHYSVMLPQCMEGLNIKPDGIYIDGTAGGAGHSRAIAERLTTGQLLSFDRDPDAVAEATKRLAPYPAAEVIHSEFARIPEVLAEKGIEGVDGILLDLGVSSYQLDNPERGFAYSVDAPLDMRMSREGMTAADILNTYDVDAMARIFREFGEERFAHCQTNCRTEGKRALYPYRPARRAHLRDDTGRRPPRRRTPRQTGLPGAAHCGEQRIGPAFPMLGYRL